MDDRHSGRTIHRFQPLRYCFALALVALALAVTLAILPLREQPGSLLFFVAVVLASWYGGIGPGLVATLMSAAALNYVALPRIYSAGEGAADAARGGVFILVAVLISGVQARWRRSERRLAVEATELERARQIQRRLLPPAPPELPGFDIAAACLPANATGGDYYDYLPMPDGRLGIAVGDVCGHGFSSALLAAELHAYLQALALTREDVGEMLTLANGILLSDIEPGRFATVFLACLDPATRSLVYASAGQEGFLFHAEGGLTRLESTGLPLGLMPDEVTRGARTVRLAAGDAVLLVTDGVYEAGSPRGAPLGLPQVLALVRAHRESSARQIVDALCQAAVSHTGRLPRTDDMTVVVIKSVRRTIERPVTHG